MAQAPSIYFKKWRIEITNNEKLTLNIVVVTVFLSAICDLLDLISK
jgi:hypothetical protein